MPKKTGRRIPPQSQKHFKRRDAAEDKRGREENTAEIMAEFARKSQWTQTEKDKDLFSGKRVPDTDYEVLLKKAYKANKNVFKLRKSK